MGQLTKLNTGNEDHRCSLRSFWPWGDNWRSFLVVSEQMWWIKSQSSLYWTMCKCLLLNKFLAIYLIESVLYIRTIWLLNNKFHELSPSGGHHSLLFDQGFKKIAGRDWSERHLTVIRTPSDGTLYWWDCT